MRTSASVAGLFLAVTLSTSVQGIDIPGTTVARTGEVVGGETLSTFRGSSINDGGEIVFAAFFGEGSISGIFSPTAILARHGDLIGGQALDVPEHPSINDAGDVVFSNQLSFVDDALFSLDDVLAAAGTRIRGTQIDTLSFAVINDGGTVVFSGWHSAFGATGIFSLSDGLIDIATVIDGRTLTQIGGDPVAGDLALNDNDELVFTAFHDGGTGLFTPTSLLVSDGDTIDGRVVSFPQDPAINDAGLVVFSATIQGDTNGIFALDRLLVKSGDVVAGLRLTSVEDPAVNDSGDLLFTGFFGAGSGIFRVALADVMDDRDCDDNGVTDSTDIANGVVEDCNGNGEPDRCDIADGLSIDCNANNVPDACDLINGTSQDCNANGIPDDCDLSSRPDCNNNGVPDECEIASGEQRDCNRNGVPDTCDLSSGTSLDCNSNEVPDLCDVERRTSRDCNLNTIPDECDLAGGEGTDCNNNSIIDDCEVPGVMLVQSGDSIADKSLTAFKGSSIDDQGDVVFAAFFDDDTGSGIFSSTVLLAEHGAMVGGEVLDFPEHPTINSSGAVAFTNQRSFSLDALFRTDALVAKAGDSINGTSVDTLSFPCITDAGEIFFSGWHSGFASSGVFSSDAGLLVDEATQISGKTLTQVGGDDFAGDIGCNDAGELAFVAFYEGDGTGIFSTTELLVDVGDVIDGKTLTFMEDPALNSDGTLVFVGFYDDGASGLFTPERLLIPVGSVVAGKTLSFVADPGLNEAGDLVFTGFFDDGAASGIFRVALADLGAEVCPRPCELEPFVDCNTNDVADACDIEDGTSTDGNQDGVPDECAELELAPFIRGDCNNDGLVSGEVSDAVFQLAFSFLGGEPPPCRAACDADSDGEISGTVSDPLFILNANFTGGPRPAAPFPDCGSSKLASDVTLGCEQPAPACQ